MPAYVQVTAFTFYRIYLCKYFWFNKYKKKNTASQESTGSSPAFLNMGRQPTPPVSLKRREERAAQGLAEATELERWRTRLQKLQDVQQSAAKNASAAHQRQSQYYNASRREVHFEIKDKVWKRNCILSSAAQGVAAKLAPKYAGPYVISAKLGSNVYELQDLEGEDCGKIHVEDLKPYHKKVDFDAEATSVADVNSARDKSKVLINLLSLLIQIPPRRVSLLYQSILWGPFKVKI